MTRWQGHACARGVDVCGQDASLCTVVMRWRAWPPCNYSLSSSQISAALTRFSLCEVLLYWHDTGHVSFAMILFDDRRFAPLSLINTREIGQRKRRVEMVSTELTDLRQAIPTHSHIFTRIECQPSAPPSGLFLAHFPGKLVLLPTTHDSRPQRIRRTGRSPTIFSW